MIFRIKIILQEKEDLFKNILKQKKNNYNKMKINLIIINNHILIYNIKKKFYKKKQRKKKNQFQHQEALK